MDESLVARIDGRMYSSNELGGKLQRGKYVDRERGIKTRNHLNSGWLHIYVTLAWARLPRLNH